MSDTSGWAFLVARGTRKGYRAVLAPDFLVRVGRHALLTERIGGTVSDKATSIEHIRDEVLGDLTVTYRVEPAPAAELAEHPATHGQDVVLDQHGRPLEMLYGLVTTEPVSAGDEDMEKARVEAVNSYRRFLADEDTADVEPSASFPLRDTVPAGAQVLPAPRMAHTTASPPQSTLPIGVSSSGTSAADGDRVHHRPARFRPALLVGLLAVLVAVSIVVPWALRGDDTADEVNVQVREESDRARPDEQPLCSDVRVVGVITADGSTSITYRWNVDGEPVAPPLTHTFDGPDSLTVDGPRVYPSDDLKRAEDDETATRTYELVVTRDDRDDRRVRDVNKIECLLAD